MLQLQQENPINFIVAIFFYKLDSFLHYEMSEEYVIFLILMLYGKCLFLAYMLRKNN